MPKLSKDQHSHVLDCNTEAENPTCAVRALWATRVLLVFALVFLIAFIPTGQLSDQFPTTI